MNLGEFKQQLKDNIRRGDSLDAVIPGFIRQAALWLERNRTMNYMRKFAEITIDPDVDDAPRYVSLEDTRIKSIQFFRWTGQAGITADDNGYLYMQMKDPRDFPQLTTGIPAFYYPNGVSSMVLSATPDQVLNGELWCARYSAWPTADSATHWLMDNAEDVLEARAMMNMAKHARDPDMRAHWKTVLDDGLIGLYAAEDEFMLENTELVMEYGGN